LLVILKMEPLSALAITSLAFIAQKAGDKLVGQSLDALWAKTDRLRQKIGNKLKGNPTAEQALSQAESGSEEAFESIADYLKVAMREDPNFATEIQALAKEIDEEVAKDGGSMIQVNRDNAKGWQTRVEGGTAYIGDIKIYQNQPSQD
jgi:hypothetical protein